MENKARIENFRYVEKANLPKNKVALCAVSSERKDILESLENLGIQCLAVGKNEEITEAVAYHSDLQILHFGEDKIVAVSKFKAELENFGFDVKKHILLDGFKYDSHSDLCALVTPKYIFARENIFSDIADEKNLTYVKVRQGYTKCSVAVVSENAYITSDMPLYKILTELGNDVLLIPSGGISLPPYEYGFIGGCCGKISEDTLAFAGSLDRFIYGEDIKNFLEKHGVKPLYLRDTNLVDVGGILPLLEYA